MAWHEGYRSFPPRWYPEEGDKVRVLSGDNEGKRGNVLRVEEGESGDYSWMNVIIKVQECGCVITANRFDVEPDEEDDEIVLN
jgi:ribosomal protein L24